MIMVTKAVIMSNEFNQIKYAKNKVDYLDTAKEKLKKKHP